MLKFSVKPGECFMIGDDIKVVFLGGVANNCRVMVDAPKNYNIVRGSVLEKNEVQKGNSPKIKRYQPEPKISKEEIQRYKEQQKLKTGNR